jgi:precorrin-2/cobalt-factor-2 C20-methyltransferase
MTGKLFVVGVGPGDPELMTLKAVKILKEAPCIFVPKGREEGSSLALSIVQKALALDGREIVEAYFPMMKTRGGADAGVLGAAWDDIVRAVLARLDAGIDAAFITIGDPSVYSTFFYLYDRLLALRPELAIEFIPGISSINAAAARARVPLGLGNERIVVLPANYLETLRETLEKYETVVLMKVNKVFDAVKDALIRAGLAKKAVYVARAGMEDERVIKDITSVRDEDLNYFSLVIVRKR